MNEIGHRARDELAVFLRRAGRDAPPALVRLDLDYVEERDAILFRMLFAGGSDWNWFAPAGAVRDPARALTPDARAATEQDLQRLYSRMLEDHLLDLELDPRRRAFAELVYSGAPAAVCERTRREMLLFEEHVRRHHRAPPTVSVDFGRLADYTTFNVVEPVLATSPNLVAELRERMERDVARAFGIPPDFVDAGAVHVEFGGQEAQARGLALLREWLTPEQRARYDADRCFEVTGSASGKRYRIRHGRQMNIDELDADGKKVCGWCFLPEGGLVAGDVMLAQKIALETNERAALNVANRFATEPRYGRSPGEIDMRPGAVNWVAYDEMVNWVPAMPTRPVVVDSTAWTGLTTT